MKTKNVLKAVLVAVVSLGMVLGSVPRNLYAVEIEDEETRYALEELNRNSYWDWQVVIDEHTRMPKTIYGSLTNRYEEAEGMPEAAQQFLNDYLYSTNVLGMRDSFFDYKMVDVINMIGTYIIYVQTYKDIPIEHSYLLISVTNQKRISLVKTETFVFSDIDTNPRMGEEEAYNIALADALKDAYVEEPGDIELVIFPKMETLQLAWRVEFKTGEFDAPIIYIISDTGEILEKSERKVSPPEPSLPGRGNPILNQEDVVAVLTALGGNTGLVNETKDLADLISDLEYGDYKQIVSESLITASSNIFNGPQNLPVYLGILKNNDFISEETYNQLMQALANLHQPPTPIGYLVRELLDVLQAALAELITYNNWLGNAMPAILGFPGPFNHFYFQLRDHYNSLLTKISTAINQITTLLITLQTQLPPEGGSGGIGSPSDPYIIFQEQIEELIRTETQNLNQVSNQLANIRYQIESAMYMPKATELASRDNELLSKIVPAIAKIQEVLQAVPPHNEDPIEAPVMLQNPIEELAEQQEEVRNNLAEVYTEVTNPTEQQNMVELLPPPISEMVSEEEIKEPLAQPEVDLLPPPLDEAVKETELIEQPKDESPVELLPAPLAENTQEPEKSETQEAGIFIEPQTNEAVLAYNAAVAEITSGPKAVTYIVQPGDTAENISLYYGVDIGSVSVGQELNFPVAGEVGQDTLEQAIADLNYMAAVVSQAQSEVQSASSDLLGLYIIKLNSAQLCYESLLIHVDALYDQLSNSTASAHDTSVTVIQDVDSGDSTTSTSTDQLSSSTEYPAYYGHEPYPQTTQTSDTTGDISDFLDDPSPSSSSDGAAATGSLSGYNSDGAAATGSITASNTDDGAGATGTLTGYYMPPSGYTTTTSSSTSTQGAGATGGISGYDYTPGSNLIAQSEIVDGSGSGSSGGGGTPITGSISG